MSSWLSITIHALASAARWLTANSTCRAAVITIVGGGFGIALNLWWNRKKHRETQLLSLRRDVYLEACDVAAEALQFATSISGADVKLAQSSPIMRRLSGIIGKLHMLAEQPTLQAIMKYHNAYYDEYAGLIPAKNCYENNEVTIEWLKQRVLGLSRVNPSGDPAVTKGIDDLTEKINKLERKNLELQKELFTAGLAVPDRLSPLAVEVTLALRRELNLKLNEIWYREENESGIKQGKERINRVMAEVTRRMGEQATTQKS